MSIPDLQYCVLLRITPAASGDLILLALATRSYRAKSTRNATDDSISSANELVIWPKAPPSSVLDGAADPVGEAPPSMPVVEVGISLCVTGIPVVEGVAEALVMTGDGSADTVVVDEMSSDGADT